MSRVLDTGSDQVILISIRASRDWPYSPAASREHLLDLLVGGEVQTDAPIGAAAPVRIKAGASAEIDRRAG